MSTAEPLGGTPTGDGASLAPSSGALPQIVAIAVEALPTLTEDAAFNLVETLVLTVINCVEELKAVRAVLASALDLANVQHLQVTRLRERRLTEVLASRQGRAQGQGRAHAQVQGQYKH